MTPESQPGYRPGHEFRDSTDTEPTRQCELRTCRRRTRGGKAYCVEHVHLNEYARKVLRERLRRNREALGVRPTRIMTSDHKGVA